MKQILIAIAFFIGLAPISAGSGHELPLEKRVFDWKPCSCSDNLPMALDPEQFRQHMMYMKGLENEYQACLKRDRKN